MSQPKVNIFFTVNTRTVSLSLAKSYTNSILMLKNVGVEMGLSQYIPERTFVTNKIFSFWMINNLLL